MLLEKYLWSVANRLVKENGFSLIHIQETNKGGQQSGVNLIKNTKSDYTFVRLIPVEFIWPNHMIQEIENTKIVAEKILKHVKGRKMKFLNLYVFQSSPSQDIHDAISRLSREEQKRIEYYFGYVDLERERIGILDKTFEKIGIPMEPFVHYLSHPSQEEPAEIFEEIKDIEKKRIEEINSIFNYGKPLLTYGIIFFNALMFLLMTFSGGSTDPLVLINYGAKESFFITNGEYWRLITPIFLHIGFIHLALNSIAIYYLGQATEKIYGSLRFFIIYIIAGIIGNLGSLFFAPSSLGAGASGAIYGLFGAFLYFGYIYPNLFFRTIGTDILTVLGINLVFSLFAPNVDIYAHLGGLIGGFIVAAIVQIPTQKGKQWRIKITSILILLLIIGVSWWGITSFDFKGSQAIYLKGEEALNKGDLQLAYRIFDHLVKEYPNQPFYHFYFANTVLQQGKPELAEKYYQQALKIEPDFPQVHYNLALISIFKDDQQSAIFHLEKALEIDPYFQEAKKLLDELKS
ncbi:hypothetical protein BHF71_10495 [Vulcanibacillus modesticaldus]|uniref:Peptidase S54 rhomboid domain-containing protein n=1 Tax=Vulcanibacillus modesticaldus TaxID=337097 RepID=A0A1D2YTF8_9BACI|nr:rhomboid family intramembrane serine protease [Vulcanibacillus modesticaldus]OEF98966.1 hypothetical protein BHF71_10495 [Vulcanibacillus modesticaldus]